MKSKFAIPAVSRLQSDAAAGHMCCWGGSLGCHFSHTTPFLRQHHPSPPSHSWSDSFRDHRNSSYDVCGGSYYSSAHGNSGSAAEPKTGFSIAEKNSELFHRLQVAYLNKVSGRYEYHSTQWARKILILYKTGDLLTRSATNKKRKHKKRTRDLWNTKCEVQIQTNLDQPSRKKEQHQTSETRPQLQT